MSHVIFINITDMDADKKSKLQVLCVKNGDYMSYRTQEGPILRNCKGPMYINYYNHYREADFRFRIILFRGN